MIPHVQRARNDTLGREATSAYGRCRGCGTLIIAEQAGTTERREFCETCKKRQGTAPEFSMDVSFAHKKQPPAR